MIMVIRCWIYGRPFPNHLPRNAIMQTPDQIHKLIFLAMVFSTYPNVGNCKFSLHICASSFFRQVEEIEACMVINMYGSAAWSCDSEQCHCSTCMVRELKEYMGAYKCELEFQKSKISQLETKLEERTQKHDNETCIIIKIMSKQTKEIRSLCHENQEIRQN